MKRTHKIIGLLLVLVLCMSFALTGCNDQPASSVPGTTAGNNPPATTGSKPADQGEELKITVVPETMEIYAGDPFEILFGVTVNNADAKLFVSDDEGFDAEVPGTYTITYTATLGDKQATATRTVTVVKALSNLTLEVVKNNMTAGKWEGVFMHFKNAQYHALDADFTTTEKLTGVFHNTSDKEIVVSVNGVSGEAAIINANGMVIEGRDGANGRLVNAENPDRSKSPQQAVIVVNGEEVLVEKNFAQAMTVPAGGYAIVVQTGAFGEKFDFDGRGFICQSVIHQYGTMIRLFWTDTNEDLTVYTNQKPVVSGNNKILAMLSNPDFKLEESILADLKATDDNGTFHSDDDVAITEFTVVNNGGFDINVPGEYTVTLSVTDGTLTTEFTRVVEVKADGVGILQVGENNKFYVDMDRVAFNQELTKPGNLAFVIYTKEFTGELLTNGWGIAFILDEYGTLVRIYDGANAKYYDADTPAIGVQDSSKVTSAGYLTEAFNSLQDGETLLAAINNGDNNHRGFLGSAASKVIGNKVSGLGMEFTKTTETITVGENSLEVGKELVIVDTQLDKADAYAFIIYTYAFKANGGTIGFTNGHGEAIVVNQYGEIVRIYDGANGKLYNAENPAGATGIITGANYDEEAFASLQEGETLIIAPHVPNTNSAENGSRWFLLKNRTMGAMVTGLGLTFEVKETTYTITVGENSLEVGKELVIVDTQLDKADAYAFIIYTYAFKANGGTIGFTNGHGEAIVVNQYGEIVRIYDGANGKLYNAENPAGATGIITGTNYDEEAFASLQEGETLIIAPHVPSTNSAENGSRWFLLKNRTMGAMVTGLGLTFEAKEN